PDLLLADEPTTQVDAESADTLRAMFAAMVAQGKTVIITTHDPTLVQACRMRFHMIAGRLEHCE
ncbi:MAG: ABC transporter ATP-binding protein, partial [Thermoguttaceae bacterium]